AWLHCRERGMPGHDQEGAAFDDPVAAQGLPREIVEREVTTSERRGTIQRRDDSRAYAYFDVDRHAFTHIDRACRDAQLGKSCTVGFELNPLREGSLRHRRRCGSGGFLTVPGVRIGSITGEHFESDSG